MSNHAAVAQVLREVQDSPQFVALIQLLANSLVENSYFADCPRDEHGHCKPSGSSKASKPKGKAGKPPSKPATPRSTPKPTGKPSTATTTPYGAEAQRHAEGNQEKLAKSLPDARAIDGNAPSDVEQESCKPKPCHRHQVEMKTLLTNKRGTVRQTSAAQARKLEHLGEGPQPVRRQWTVVVDHRNHYAAGKLDNAKVFPLYIREGTGSFNVKSMHKVESADELQTVLNTPAEKLPDNARPPTSGFYAQWMESSATMKKRMAKAAYARERQRVQRKQEKTK